MSVLKKLLLPPECKLKGKNSSATESSIAYYWSAFSFQFHLCITGHHSHNGIKNDNSQSLTKLHGVQFPAKGHTLQV